MKKTLLLALIALLPVITFADVIKVNLSDALKKGIVKMDAVNTTGSFKGRAVKLTITNNSKDKIEVKVDLGMILKPYIPSFQPMVLAGEEVLALKAREKGEVDVQVFCGNAPKSCPVKDLPYSYLRVSGDTLVRVLRFIKENNLYDHLGQAAVWVITNDHALQNVYDPLRDEQSNKLIDLLAQVTRKPKPAYYSVKEDNETQAQPAYLGKTAKIIVPFDVKLGASTVVTVSVYEPHGNLVKNLIDRRMFAAGTHNLKIDINPEDFQKGKYTVKVSTPEKVLQEKEVTIE